jgi:tetratricopeptide (TPR) repeat protein
MQVVWSILSGAEARPYLLALVIAPLAMIVINLLCSKIRAKIDPKGRNILFHNVEEGNDENIQKMQKMFKEMEQIDAKNLLRGEREELFKDLTEKYGLKDYFEEKRKERVAQSEITIRKATERIERKTARWQDYVERAGEYMHRKQWNAAIADWTKVILLKPDVKEAYYGRSLAYFEIKEYDRAYTDALKVQEFIKKRDSYLLDDIKKAMQIDNPEKR